nr:unnamed protein product [Digitaria exilis]
MLGPQFQLVLFARRRLPSHLQASSCRRAPHRWSGCCLPRSPTPLPAARPCATVVRRPRGSTTVPLPLLLRTCASTSTGHRGAQEQGEGRRALAAAGLRTGGVEIQGERRKERDALGG